MNNNELKNLAKNFNKVIEKLTDGINERFKIYNEFIIELDQRLTEQDKRIKELEEHLEEQIEINKQGETK